MINAPEIRHISISSRMSAECLAKVKEGKASDRFSQQQSNISQGIRCTEIFLWSHVIDRLCSPTTHEKLGCFIIAPMQSPRE